MASLTLLLACSEPSMAGSLTGDACSLGVLLLSAAAFLSVWSLGQYLIALWPYFR